MLTEGERRQLARIERELRDDPGLRGSLKRMNRFGGRHAGKVRALVAFGVLLMIAGPIVGADQAFMQGVVIVSVVAAWWVVVKTDLIRGDQPESNARHDRSHGAPDV